MDSNTPKIKTTRTIYPQIYSYVLPDSIDHAGSQKIGYTERLDVNKRIKEQTKTAAIRLDYSLLWNSPSFFVGDKKGSYFKDKDFHEFLRKKGVENRNALGREWYFFNDHPEKSKNLLDLFKREGFRALQSDEGKLPYSLRPEQEDAVVKALEYFQSHKNGEFLWNAKPRFGKTLSSYDLMMRLNAKNVLIVTNRPAIANSWFDDYQLFVPRYKFISTTDSLKERPVLSRDQFVESAVVGDSQISFLSLQDLKGSRYFGGKAEKLRWVADLEWDLLIIDEAHEGVDTIRTDAAFEVIKRKHTLHLSGTPFKALANNKFPQEAIFNWTYLDEQEAKKAELDNPEIGEAGPHVDLPDLRLYTYRISEMTVETINKGIEIDDTTKDYAFDLNEFFAVEGKKFRYEDAVKSFLRNLTTNTKYPFSTPELRDELRHTFWYVGNRVDSSKALEKLLREDPIFKDYKVVIAAGDGRTFEEEEKDYRGNERSYDKVREAIENHDKTITLSCGQLTTGVTIPEWSAVLMLTDIKTPALYMQAAFRAQNPYSFFENGELKIKQSAYLFDFAPSRVLEIYDEFANGLNPKAVDGEITEEERKNNIKQLLNFFPVISEDRDGQMIELDAEKVLTFPNALAAAEIVKARFMTNLLFNDNIKNVFSLPKAVEDIVNKLPEEKNKRPQKPKSSLNLDDAKKVEQEKAIKINENTGAILGERIYGANIDRLIDGADEDLSTPGALDKLVTGARKAAEPLFDNYQHAYSITRTELKEIKEEVGEKIREIAQEFVSEGITDKEEQKSRFKNLLEEEFVNKEVEKQESQKVEEVRKDKESEIRDRLRAFTRTIPMFIMANSATRNITIDNFEEEISEEDFVDLTNITKQEFYTLRDGFDYEENGERKHFGGVFDKYRFNASIAEFLAAKRERANYFSVEEDIFELIPNQKNNQIFTPRNVVTMMLDGLEEEAPEIFTSRNSTFIDLYMKSGMYITETVKRLFAGTRHLYDTDEECIRYILENQVYGLSPTGILDSITKAYIFGFDENHNINKKNFVQHDLLPEAKEGAAKEKVFELFNLPEGMKFTAVVGNPPYQLGDEGRREDGSENASASPIYHLFAHSAEQISRLQSIVMPARWLSGAGKGLGHFTRDMLNKKSLRTFSLYTDSGSVFPNVDIKGGVCFYLNDKSFNGLAKITVTTSDSVEVYKGSLNSEESGVFIPFKELISILGKVKKNESSLSEKNMQSIISVRKPYGLSTDFFRNPKKYGFPELQNSKLKDDDIEIVGLDNGKRSSRFAPSNYPIEIGRETIGKWKVFAPYAYGAGALGEAGPTPMLGKPMLICTETFLRIGSFDTREEAENVMKYYKTKLLRVLVGILKTTQHSTTTFRFVPLQDFTANSDIDWSKTIPEIDQQLYKKYGLSQHEIDFIEEKVKPME